MGFFDKLAATAFRKNPDGSVMYFPNGVFGKGRIVRDSARRQKLFNYHKRIFKYVLPLSILYGFAVGVSGGFTKGHLMFIAVVAAMLFARQQYLVRGLPVFSDRPTITEIAERGAKAFPPLLLMLFGGSSLILIVGGAAMPLLFHTSTESIVFSMVALVTFGVLGLTTSVYLYKVRKSNYSVQPTQKRRG